VFYSTYSKHLSAQKTKKTTLKNSLNCHGSRHREAIRDLYGDLIFVEQALKALILYFFVHLKTGTNHFLQK